MVKKRWSYGDLLRLDNRYNFSYTQHMKTAISIPDELFEEAEAAAKRLGVSRSRLYSEAVRAFLEVHSREAVTEKLNEVYAQHGCSLDAVVERLQFASIREGKKGW